MKVGKLLSLLETAPRDADVRIAWEDFAEGDIQLAEYDAENGDFVIYHDITGWPDDKDDDKKGGAK